MTAVCLESEQDKVKSLDVNMSGVRLQLQGLRQLQRLKLSNVKWDFEGFSQLTVLSSLTKLKADACDIADAGLALAFQRLTGLRKLVLWTPLPNNACLLVAMACLSNLEHLDFGDEDSELVVTSANLPVLSPLTKLAYLTLLDQRTDTGERTVSDAAQDALLDNMPHLTAIEWV
jgi:hypothetical protein